MTPEIYEQLVNPTPVIKYYFLSTFPKNTTGKVTTLNTNHGVKTHAN